MQFIWANLGYAALKKNLNSLQSENHLRWQENEQLWNTPDHRNLEEYEHPAQEQVTRSNSSTISCPPLVGGLIHSNTI